MIDENNLPDLRMIVSDPSICIMNTDLEVKSIIALDIHLHICKKFYSMLTISLSILVGEIFDVEKYIEVWGTSYQTSISLFQARRPANLLHEV